MVKKLMNLDYNVILLSHDDLSKDITKKGGDKITAINPAMPEKVTKTIAGLTDMVGWVTLDSGERKISFKPNEFTFGGGRLEIEGTEIPCEYDALCGLYKKSATIKEASSSTETETVERKPRERKVRKEETDSIPF